MSQHDQQILMSEPLPPEFRGESKLVHLTLVVDGEEVEILTTYVGRRKLISHVGDFRVFAENGRTVLYLGRRE